MYHSVQRMINMNVLFLSSSALVWWQDTPDHAFRYFASCWVNIMMDLKTQLLADLYASVESKLKVGITTSGTNKIRLTEISSIKPKPVRLTDGGIFSINWRNFFQCCHRCNQFLHTFRLLSSSWNDSSRRKIYLMGSTLFQNNSCIVIMKRSAIPRRKWSIHVQHVGIVL